MIISEKQIIDLVFSVYEFIGVLKQLKRQNNLSEGGDGLLSDCISLLQAIKDQQSTELRNINDQNN